MDRDTRRASGLVQTANKNAQHEDPNGSHGMRDEILIQRIRGGETELFQELLHPYLRSVFALVRSVVTDHADAEDTVQEAVLRAFSNLDQLRSGHAFRAWLFQIAVNEARMLRRRNAQRLCFKSVDEAMDGDQGLQLGNLAEWHDIPSSRLEREEWRAILRRALEDLPCRRREVFVLRDIEELSTQETAEILGVSAAAVKARLHRARLHLRAKLSLVLSFGRHERGTDRLCGIGRQI